MPDPIKSKVIEELHDKFSRVKGAVLSDFKGMSAQQMNALRRELRDKSVELRVVKNTLAKRSMEGTPFKVLEEYFKGPTSIALSYDNVVTPAKILTEFAKKEPKLKLTAGFAEGEKVDASGIKDLANLPPREVLLGQMLAVTKGSTRNFVGTCNAVLSNFVGVLSAIQEKKENSV